MQRILQCSVDTVCTQISFFLGVTVLPLSIRTDANYKSGRFLVFERYHVINELIHHSVFKLKSEHGATYIRRCHSHKYVNGVFTKGCKNNTVLG